MAKILVFLEENKGSLKRSATEVSTAAQGKGDVTGVIINGSAEAISQAGQFGISKVINIESDILTNYSSQAASKALAQVVSNKSFDVILFSANSTGKELAPRLSAILSASYVADCIDLDNDFSAIKPVFAGKAQVKVVSKTAIKIFSLRPNIFTAQTNQVSVSSEDFAPTLNANDAKVKVTGVSKNEGKIDVAEADIIVSGGRGLKGPENFNLIENLASALKGGVGASRAVVDAGWRPHGEQVGQTGKTVSPNLYVACAISGAVQHLAGMSSSKIIVAINKDKDAPIFKVADYGLVGDVFEILPKLTEKIKALG